MSEWIFGFVLAALVLEAMPRLRLRVRAFLMLRETLRAIQDATPVDEKAVEYWPPATRLDVWQRRQAKRMVKP